MYTPPHFRADNEDELYELMEEFSFATLVSAGDGPPTATLAPFVLRRDATGGRRLWGHIARSNPQWQSLDEKREVLVIFRGPDAYISPSWYTNSPNVPTWNFTVVHAYGLPHLLAPDHWRTRWILEQTVDQYESRLEEPWRLEVPTEYFTSLVQGVVAFEIELTQLEGQFKLSQNHPQANRLGVIAGLERRPDTAAREVARIMREREGKAAL